MTAALHRTYSCKLQNKEKQTYLHKNCRKNQGTKQFVISIQVCQETVFCSTVSHAKIIFCDKGEYIICINSEKYMYISRIIFRKY